jgi:AraC-like DNA-binding protein
MHPGTRIFRRIHCDVRTRQPRRLNLFPTAAPVAAQGTTKQRANHLKEITVHTSLSSFHQHSPALTATVAQRVETAVPHRHAETRQRHPGRDSASPGSAGLIVFDHRGRLVKANVQAEVSLSAIGVELNRSPRLRIDALDASDSKPADNARLPDWLDSDWIKPIVEGSERLGTVVEIPERFFSRALLRQSGLPTYKLRRAMDFIQSHIDQPILLGQVAAAVALSPFHFHREFKRATGMTPHQYIVHVRMERAKTLLSDSDLSLVEVAAQVGFADQSHFSSTFRKATAMTPRSYRNATAIA